MYADSTEKIEKAAEDYKPLMMASLPYKYREVEVDPIHQRQLLGNGGRQLKPIQDNGVDVVFERDDPVALLVYTKDPTVPGVAKEIEQALTEAEGQLSELVSALPTISEQRLKIPAEYVPFSGHLVPMLISTVLISISVDREIPLSMLLQWEVRI